MQKNKTISFLNGSHEYSFESKDFFSPKNVNLSQMSGNWDSGNKKVSGLMNTTGNSMMNKLEQINEIEENQKLRVELFKAKRTFSSIESESDNLKEMMSRITNKINKSKKQKTQKHNKENKCSEESMVMDIIVQVQQFLNSMEILCQENQKQAERKEQQLKKIQSHQKKGAKVYKKILKTCEDKLQSAEQLLLEVTTRLQQKEKTLKMTALKCEEYQRSIKEKTQKYETLQKEKRLLQSDIEVYKEQLEKRSLQNCELKNTSFESMEKYENIFNEYQRLQKKAEWFEKMYEEKRMKVTNIEQQKLNFFEEASRQNNKLNTRIQELEKDHRNEKKKLLEELDNFKKAYQIQENKFIGELKNNRQTQIREKQQINQELVNAYELYRLQQERSLYFQNQVKSHQSVIHNIQRQIIQVNKVNQGLSNRIDTLQDEIKTQEEKVVTLQTEQQKIIQQKQELQEKVAEVEEDMQVVLAELKIKENLLDQLKYSMEKNIEQSVEAEKQQSVKQESLEYQDLQQVQREKPQRFKLQDFQYRNSFAIKNGYRGQLL